MNTINGTAALVAKIRELAGNRSGSSIADIVGDPNPTGLEALRPSEFTDKYEMQALVNTLRSNADMQLALIQMVDSSRHRTRG